MEKEIFFQRLNGFAKGKKNAVAAKLFLATFRSGEKYFFAHLVSLLLTVFPQETVKKIPNFFGRNEMVSEPIALPHPLRDNILHHFALKHAL